MIALEREVTVFSMVVERESMKWNAYVMYTAKRAEYIDHRSIKLHNYLLKVAGRLSLREL
jgi:hypothetical protein